MSELSILRKSWVYKDYDHNYVSYLKENYSLDEIVAKLLSIRKINKEYVESFLNPSIKELIPNPNSLKDMEITVKRLIKAISNKEKIGIFGDYDVDGASSTAIIGNYLFKSINQEFETYIPDRSTEGYGPSIDSFQKLINKNINLIITVDHGTTSYKAIEFANSKNIDVIVLDHHQSELNLPKAFSIINPNRVDDKSNLGVIYVLRVLLYDTGVIEFKFKKRWLV